MSKVLLFSLCLVLGTAPGVASGEQAVSPMAAVAPSADASEVQSAPSKEQGAAVMRIKYERHEAETTITGWGTAFAISQDQLLTAAHNVLDDRGQPHATIRVELNGRWVPALVVRFNKEIDIAIVAVEEVMPQHVELAQVDARVGAPVTLTGSARGRALKTFDGKISKRFYEGRCTLLAAIPFEHGYSGCPLFDADGKVVGLAVAGLPGAQWSGQDMDHTCGLFLPVSVIRAFLEDK